MPGIADELDPKKCAELYAQIDRELIAKGLMVGSGKFMEVRYRKFNQRKGRCYP